MVRKIRPQTFTIDDNEVYYEIEEEIVLKDGKKIKTKAIIYEEEDDS